MEAVGTLPAPMGSGFVLGSLDGLARQIANVIANLGIEIILQDASLHTTDVEA